MILGNFSLYQLILEQPQQLQAKVCHSSRDGQSPHRLIAALDHWWGASIDLCLRQLAMTQKVGVVVLSLS